MWSRTNPTPRPDLTVITPQLPAACPAPHRQRSICEYQELEQPLSASCSGICSYGLAGVDGHARPAAPGCQAPRNGKPLHKPFTPSRGACRARHHRRAMQRAWRRLASTARVGGAQSRGRARACARGCACNAGACLEVPNGQGCEPACARPSSSKQVFTGTSKLG